MERRTFLTSSLIASALSVATPAGRLLAAQDAPQDQTKQHPKEATRELYLIRRYVLTNGPQRKLCDDFFRVDLVPALNRLSITPVGVFDLAIGAQTPSVYVLMPSVSAELLVNLETHLAQDAVYLKAGAPFLNAAAAAPAFVRMESSLMVAFEKMPRLTLPAATATHSPRVFELRTYESPSDLDHKRKVEMMQSGEEEIFAKAGFSQVFYGDTVIGPRMPNLTYMLSYESVSVRDKKWADFLSSPAWKSMSSQPRYSFENIVSGITALILTPTDYSQI